MTTAICDERVRARACLDAAAAFVNAVRDMGDLRTCAGSLTMPAAPRLREAGRRLRSCAQGFTCTPMEQPAYDAAWGVCALMCQMVFQDKLPAPTLLREIILSDSLAAPIAIKRWGAERLRDDLLRFQSEFLQAFDVLGHQPRVPGATGCRIASIIVGQPGITSEAIAKSMRTEAGYVRRVFAKELRPLGFTGRGHPRGGYRAPAWLEK